MSFWTVLRGDQVIPSDLNLSFYPNSSKINFFSLKTFIKQELEFQSSIYSKNKA